MQIILRSFAKKNVLLQRALQGERGASVTQQRHPCKYIEKTREKRFLAALPTVVGGVTTTFARNSSEHMKNLENHLHERRNEPHPAAPQHLLLPPVIARKYVITQNKTLWRKIDFKAPCHDTAALQRGLVAPEDPTFSMRALYCCVATSRCLRTTKPAKTVPLVLTAAHYRDLRYNVFKASTVLLRCKRGLKKQTEFSKRAPYCCVAAFSQRKQLFDASALLPRCRAISEQTNQRKSTASRSTINSSSHRATSPTPTAKP